MIKQLLISSKLSFTLLIFCFGLSVFYGSSQVGSNDPSFNMTDPGFGIGDGTDVWVDATVLLPDGKYLIGGAFTKYNDVSCKGIIRINHDGSIDPTWNIGGVGATNSTYGAVYNIAVQPDGKIIIVGDFTKYNGVTRNRIARLNADGTLDTSFDPGTGLNNLTSEIVLLPNGQMLVGGAFSTVNGTSCIAIARLNTDGSLDPTFNSGGSGVSYSGSSYSNSVGAIVVLSDGRIYIGGSFTYYNNAIRIREAILYADGTLDPTFVTGTGTGGPSSTVQDATQQPDGKLVIVGDFNNYNGISRNSIARINLDGTLDMTLNPSYSSSIGFDDGLRNVDILPDGDILASGQASVYSGTTISKIARLNSDGSLDAGFSTGTGFTYPSYSAYVSISLPQVDGKILVGGTFKYLNGQYYRNLVRLNSDGTLDPSFNSGSGFNSGAVNSVKELPDGKLIVGGEFNRFNGVTREGLVKLNADGTLDSSFPITNFSNGDFKCVRKVIIQPDGKILIAGSFYGINGSSRKCIARLNADGTLETVFNPNITISDTIHAMVLQPDGKIVIGGKFSAVDGVSRSNIARLNADGTLDATFTTGSGFLLTVRSLALQSDGKVIVGGDFTYYASTAINRITRLNTNGTLDATFNVGNGCNNAVNSITVQPDGKILIGGKFNTFNSTIAYRMTRVLTNGSPDPSFVIGTGFNNTVSEIYLKDDGKIFVGGRFTTFNGNAQKGLICLNPGGSVNTSFQFGTGVSSNTDVRSILQLSNNKILIAGDFTSYNGIGRNRMAWLNSPANTYNTINQTVCNSYTGPSGANYTTSGTYLDVIPNAAGTDSIITLHLTINPTIYHSNVVTSCEPYTWSNGVTYSSNTTVSQTLSSQTGCDSIVTLQLTINQPSSGIQVISACESYTWINGVTYNASTSLPTHTLINSHGCDSIVTLHLTIHSPTSGTHIVSACESYTWIDGVTYSSSNSSATHHLQNSFGCDSLVTLNLTILQPSSSFVSMTACDNYSWSQNGVTYTTSGNYTDVIPNQAGCDSIVTLQLTILQSSSVVVEEVTACGEYTWVDGTTYISSTNSPNIVLQNAMGCDSVISLHLTINPLPAASASDNGDGTVSASGGGTYQWIDCVTNAILVNETNATFAPTLDGSYAVIVTNTESCENTSSCVIIDYLGLDNSTLSNVSIHPNPTIDWVTINLSNGKAQLTIQDAQGKHIFSKEIVNGEKVSLQNEKAGVYFFTLDTEAGKKIARVVKW